MKNSKNEGHPANTRMLELLEQCGLVWIAASLGSWVGGGPLVGAYAPPARIVSGDKVVRLIF